MAQVNIGFENIPTIFGVESRNPQISGAYVASLTDVPGVVAANNYMSIENPTGGTKLIVLSGLFISTYSTAASSTRNSLQGFLATGLSGGTTIASSAISKFDSTTANATAVVRSGNPTATTGAVIFNSPPPIGTTTSQYVHSVGNGGSSAAGGLILRPGEGLVMRTAAGNTNQTWNISIEWMEI